jgi:hypothetical protein
MLLLWWVSLPSDQGRRLYRLSVTVSVHLFIVYCCTVCHIALPPLWNVFGRYSLSICQAAHKTAVKCRTPQGYEFVSQSSFTGSPERGKRSHEKEKEPLFALTSKHRSDWRNCMKFLGLYGLYWWSRVRISMMALHFLNLPNTYNHTMALGSTQPPQRIFFGGARHARKADNLTAIFEPTL